MILEWFSLKGTQCMDQPIALFAGSFDPFHEGHANIITKALPLFRRLYVVVTKNWHKTPTNSYELRVSKLQAYYQNEPKIVVLMNKQQLTVDFAHRYQVNYLIRGVRSYEDYQFEQKLAVANYYLDPHLTTLLFFTDPELEQISSSFIKEIKLIKAKSKPNS